MITTGPTYEKIDPVRFIGNFSSGKMGFSIAEKLADEGALVTLISGPSACQTTHPNIHRIDVVSAKEMYEASIEHFPNCDGAIMTAAVADFTPLNPVDAKVKREKSNYTIELTPTKDIAASLGKIKSEKQFLVGFALETNDEEQNAQLKLEKKNLDLIVLNSLNDSGAGFQHDTNKITIFSRSGQAKVFDLKTKKEVAADIVDALILNQNF
ncbi:DNA/pantothenate metabolism flavoprotein [Ancylomarina subtilis]|uniref:DNA/pantothenate metabolism flavoprotein n=1 Tax=Ancylomarina subtilis TaxID=1639035 RepID=A0A4Q7VCA3_9BACT|nr:phosphopantothenoylcysteine decarboxylase [Ancylomarina subtilis]RZT93494.1 DNA/pantothenate metabolism flavoprotein [Ancylomarina subtilis]